MKFIEDDLDLMKFLVKDIYKKEKYPRSNEVNLWGQISDLPDEKVLGSYFYSDTAPFMHKIDEELIAIKGLENRKELHRKYSHFARDIYNNNISNLVSIRRLLKERSAELEKAYFMETRPIMEFLTHDTIGEKVYSESYYNYRKLAAMLCYMNMLGFEKLIGEMPESYEIFTSYKIAWKIHEEELEPWDEFTKELMYTTSGDYLLKQISRAKEIVLRYQDIDKKLFAINRILNQGLINYKKTEFGKISFEDANHEIFNERLQRKFLNSINSPVKPSQEQLDDWIEKTAKRLESNSIKFKDPKTIELYLTALTNNKMASLNELKEKVLSNGHLSESDATSMKNAHHNTIAGWEKQFQKVLYAHNFLKYAQSFKRSYDFQ